MGKISKNILFMNKEGHRMEMEKGGSEWPRWQGGCPYGLGGHPPFEPILPQLFRNLF